MDQIFMKNLYKFFYNKVQNIRQDLCLDPQDYATALDRPLFHFISF